PYPLEECPTLASLRDGAARHVADEVFWRKDGTPLAVEYHSTPIREGETLAGAVVIFSDVAGRLRAEEALRRLALEGPLPGAPSRALVRARLRQALLSAERDEAPLALLVLDLDGFKEVNETLGHAAGDAVLQEVGRRLRAALPPSDTVARLGGDEFAALL